MASLEQQLADERPTQLARFEVLAPEFRARYEELDTRTHRFLAEEWQTRNSEPAESLRPQPPRDFIRHPVILFVMFVDGSHSEEKLRVAESVLGPDELRRVLGEDPVGGPPLCSGRTVA